MTQTEAVEAAEIILAVPNHCYTEDLIAHGATVARAYLSQTERVRALEAMLTKAADQFEFYAKEHRQKAHANRHNGMQAAEEAAWKKCYVNENMATDCRAALAQGTA